MFLNLTLASRHTSLIIASSILNPALAYFPCSRALHVKCRCLPKDITSSPNIRTIVRGRDSAPVRGVPYKPAAPYRVCKAKFELVKVFWQVVATVEEL